MLLPRSIELSTSKCFTAYSELRCICTRLSHLLTAVHRSGGLIKASRQDMVIVPRESLIKLTLQASHLKAEDACLQDELADLQAAKALKALKAGSYMEDNRPSRGSSDRSQFSSIPASPARQGGIGSSALTSVSSTPPEDSPHRECRSKRGRGGVASTTATSRGIRRKYRQRLSKK